MFRAINEDKVEFIQLFLEKGFSMKNFLTYRVLFKLYNSIPVQSTLYKLLNYYDKGKVKAHVEINELEELLNDKKFNENKDFSNAKKYTFKNIGLVIQYLVDDLYKDKFTEIPFSIIKSKDCEKVLNDTDEFGNMKPHTIGIFNDMENDLKSNFFNFLKRF